MPSREPPLRRSLSYVWWPALFGGAVAAVYAGMLRGHPILAFNLTYLGLALVVGVLERVMPHRRAWLRNDGQITADLAHTLLNKSVAQVIIAVAVFLGIADWLRLGGAGMWLLVWPSGWPLALQTALGLVIAEAGLYWKHRLAHEWPMLWRFHAVHHSTTRLWFFNTGRFHLVDTVTGLAVGMPALLLLGAPQDVLILVSAVTAFVGILTHCNIEMRCGWLNYVFNTPSLHRWHHSKVPDEGNRNYGENLMLFDLMLGTFYLPARQPPRDIGIRHAMPPTFLGQLTAPFTIRPL
jgi:sterol desaturase/sphingolipid hydroxylase (fatty acid hydroxylase superfamily)